jgi:hypothetical protein
MKSETVEYFEKQLDWVQEIKPLSFTPETISTEITPVPSIQEDAV